MAEGINSNIRDEGNYTKQCFTTFMFQAFAMCSIILGIASAYQGKLEAQYVCYFVVAIATFVSKVGTYKYITSNRNYAYELFQNRIESIPDQSASDITLKIKELDWEEAMLAWRIVQTKIYRKMYTKYIFAGWRLKREFRRKKTRNAEENPKWYPWWDTKLLLEGGYEIRGRKVKLQKAPKCRKDGSDDYNPGSYLRNMQRAFYALVTIALLVAFVINAKAVYLKIFCLESASVMYFGCPVDDIALVLNCGIFIFVLIFAVSRGLKDVALRSILEHGMFSIQAFALVWHAVAIAHFQAKEKTYTSYYGYTNALNDEVSNISKYLNNLHLWVNADGNLGEYRDIS